MATFGERSVGLSFNPSKNPDVDEVKKLCADFIDFCDVVRHEAENPEIRRMMSVAITECQTAQMWAVKALTWSE